LWMNRVRQRPGSVLQLLIARALGHAYYYACSNTHTQRERKKERETFICIPFTALHHTQTRFIKNKIKSIRQKGWKKKNLRAVFYFKIIYYKLIIDRTTNGICESQAKYKYGHALIDH
jgi:hypothetical protein